MAVKIFILSVFIMFACHISGLNAAGLGIAFTINDTAVTDFDMENMMKFIAALEGKSVADYSGNSKTQLRQKAESAKTEQLIKQREAARYNISVSEQELENAMSIIPDAGRIKEKLKANKVPVKVYEDTVRSDLMWIKLIRQLYMEKVYPSAEDIASHIRQNPMDDAQSALNNIVSSRLEQAAFTMMQDLQRKAVIEK